MEPASSSSGRVTPGPGLGIRTTSKSSQPLDIVPQVVVREIHVTGPKMPVEARGSGHQPAVVFKEDATAGPLLTVNLDQSPAVPGDKESAKPPFHLIIVNVHDQNQSGELRVIWTTFIPPGQRVSHLLFFSQFYSPSWWFHISSEMMIFLGILICNMNFEKSSLKCISVKHF